MNYWYRYLHCKWEYNVLNMKSCDVVKLNNKKGGHNYQFRNLPKGVFKKKNVDNFFLGGGLTAVKYIIFQMTIATIHVYLVL